MGQDGGICHNTDICLWLHAPAELPPITEFYAQMEKDSGSWCCVSINLHRRYLLILMCSASLRTPEKDQGFFINIKRRHIFRAILFLLRSLQLI